MKWRKFVFCMLTASGCAGASDHDSLWTAKLGVQHRSVEEFSVSGARLLKESGWEPLLEIGNRTRLFRGSVETKLFLSGSELNYEGRTQNGVPIDSDTDYRQGRLSLGYVYPLSEAMALLARLESAHIERDIQGVGDVSGLRERYESRRLIVGIEKEFNDVNYPFRLGIEGVIGLNGSQEISSPGAIDPVSLPEGDSWGVRAEAVFPWANRWTPGFSWAVVPTVGYQHTDRSENRPWTQDGRIRGVIAQPETRSWNIGIGLSAYW